MTHNVLSSKGIKGVKTGYPLKIEVFTYFDMLKKSGKTIGFRFCFRQDFQKKIGKPLLKMQSFRFPRFFENF